MSKSGHQHPHICNNQGVVSYRRYFTPLQPSGVPARRIPGTPSDSRPRGDTGSGRTFVPRINTCEYKTQWDISPFNRKAKVID